MTCKYDRAAYRSDHDKWDILKIEHLIDEFSKNDNLFYKKYKQRLYCPECNQVLLSFVDSTEKKQHLRAYPNSHHANTCSHFLDEVSSQQLETYMSDTQHTQDIQKRLKSTIRMLLRNEELDNNPLVVAIENGLLLNHDVPRNVVLNRNHYRSIPNKSLTAPFYDTDFQTHKIFYGLIDIVWKEEQNWGKKYYYIEIHRPNCIDVCFRLRISEHVYKHLPQPYKDNSKNVCISFYSKADPNDEFNALAYLRLSQHLLIDME